MHKHSFAHLIALQFIATTVCLTLLTGIIAAMDAWDPRNVFCYTMATILLFGSALPGYVVDTIYWDYVRAGGEQLARGWGRWMMRVTLEDSRPTTLLDLGFALRKVWC